MEKVYEQNLEECEYCEQTHYKFEMGYSEYRCSLYGRKCLGGEIDTGCPLSFKYQIE